MFSCILKHMLAALVLCFAVQFDVAGITYCTSNNTVPSEGCYCTTNYQPTGCTCGLTTDCNCLPAEPDGETNTWELVDGNTVPGEKIGPLSIWYFHRQINNGVTPSISFVLTAPGTYYVYYGDCSGSKSSSSCKWGKIDQANTRPTVYTYTLAANDNNTSGIKKMEFYRKDPAQTYNTNWPVMTFSEYVSPDYCGYNYKNYNKTTYNLMIFSYTIRTIAGVDGRLGSLFPSLGSASGKQPLFTGMFAGTGLGCYYNLPDSNTIPAVPNSNFFNGITTKSYTLTSKQFAYMFYDAACFGHKQYPNDSTVSDTPLPDGWFNNTNLNCATTNLFNKTFAVENDTVSSWAAIMPADLTQK